MTSRAARRRRRPASKLENRGNSGDVEVIVISDSEGPTSGSASRPTERGNSSACEVIELSDSEGSPSRSTDPEGDPANDDASPPSSDQDEQEVTASAPMLPVKRDVKDTVIDAAATVEKCMALNFDYPVEIAKKNAENEELLAKKCALEQELSDKNEFQARLEKEDVEIEKRRKLFALEEGREWKQAAEFKERKARMKSAIEKEMRKLEKYKNKGATRGRKKTAKQDELEELKKTLLF